MYGEASVLVKRTPDGQNLHSLCYSISHNHMMVMGSEAPHIINYCLPYELIVE